MNVAIEKKFVQQDKTMWLKDENYYFLSLVIKFITAYVSFSE